MTEQNEALRLAEWIESDMSCDGDEKIVAELRRQHEEITQLRHGAGVANQTIVDIVAQRDQLLKALKKIEAIDDKMCSQTQRARDIARAAIKAVER